MRRFSSRKRISPGLNLAPMLDVVLLLLIFFMLNSSFIQPSVKLDLPQGRNPGMERRQEIVITIGRNERIYVNREPVELDALPRALSEMFAAGADPRVTFRADGGLSWSFTFQVIDRAMEGGARQINFAHRMDESDE